MMSKYIFEYDNIGIYVKSCNGTSYCLTEYLEKATDFGKPANGYEGIKEVVDNILASKVDYYKKSNLIVKTIKAA